MRNLKIVVVVAVLALLLFFAARMIESERMKTAQENCAATDLYVWPRGEKYRVYLCPKGKRNEES